MMYEIPKQEKTGVAINQNTYPHETEGFPDDGKGHSFQRILFPCTVRARDPNFPGGSEV